MTADHHLERSAPLLAVLAALLVLPGLGDVASGAVAAQVVRGYVVDDSTEVGLEDVVVTVVRDDARLRQVTTDAEGYFLIELTDSMTVQLEGRRLGWRTVLSQPLHIPPSDTVSVELWMGVRAIPVAPLYVTGRSNLGRSRFFRHMEEWGKGIFITPDMVDSIAPMHPVDVLRRQPETWLSWRMGQRKPVPNIRTYLGQGCVKFMINGIEVRNWGPGDRDVAGGAAFEDTALENLRGSEIVAVEYYRYVGEVPPELRRFTDIGLVGMCGLVVYWTREAW